MNIGGTITLSGVTARDLERVWAHKAEYDSFNINTQQIQQAPSPEGKSVYNNVPLTFSTLEGLSTITELARELEDREKAAKNAATEESGIEESGVGESRIEEKATEIP